MVTICDNGVMREMTQEEINILNNLPDPTNPEPEPEEILSILLGGDAE